MQGIDSDLIRGHIDTIILKVLFEGDKYGIEICKEVEEKSNGTYELKQPTLYSCLKRLETQGLISSYWEESEIGGKRHYYKLTDEGRETFKNNYDEWTRSREIIDNLISNPFIKAKSYTLVDSEEIENLEKKAQTSDENSINEEQLKRAVAEAYENGLSAGKSEAQNDATNDLQKAVNEAYERGLADGKNEEKQKAYADNEKALEQQKLVDSLLSSNLSEDFETIPWKEETHAEPINEDQETTNADSQMSETFSYWNDNDDDAFVTVTANGEPVGAVVNDEDQPENAEADNYFDDEQLPFEEVNKAQASFFESNDDVEETNEDNAEPVAYIEHNPEPEVAYEQKPRLSAPEPKPEEETPFVFNMDSFMVKSNESFFDSSDIDEPKPDYTAEMRIDGFEERKPLEPIIAQEDEKEETTAVEQSSASSPVYHDFGADEIIKRREVEEQPVEEDDEIYVDDSNIDVDEIYLNPELANEPEEDEQSTVSDGQLSLFDESANEAPSENIFEEKQSAGNSTFMDFYKNTESYDNLDPSYTDEDSKEKLSSLMSYGTNEHAPSKEVYMPKVMDYSELKAEFEKEGLTVKPHIKHLKESKDSRSYVESNKINLVTSWTSYLIVAFLLTIAYFINGNYKMSASLSYPYFLTGLGLLMIVPIIYTILFIINPYKKKPARYAFRIYMLFAILLTVQLCIIDYCVNLQLGFYSFTQPTYNHLMWIVPAIISLYPIIDAVIHNVYFRSKNFHV